MKLSNSFFVVGLAAISVMNPSHAEMMKTCKVNEFKNLRQTAFALVPDQQSRSWNMSDSLRYLDNVLDNWTFAQKLNSNWLSQSENKELLESMRQRDLGDTWYQYHYLRNFGLNSEELFAFVQAKFNLDRSTFEARLPFESGTWAKSIYLNEDHILKFYELHKTEWKKPRQYFLSLIVDSSANDLKIESQIKKENFEVVAAKMSLDTASAHQNGVLGWYYQGVEPGVLGPFGKWLYDTLFVQKNVKSHVFKKKYDQLTYWIKVSDFRDEEIPPLDTVRDYAINQFTNQYFQKVGPQVLDSLSKIYGARLLDLPYPKDRDYYNSHPQNFMSPVSRRIYLMESKDSSALTAVKVANGEEFRQKALQGQKNLYAPDADLGWVNEGWGLPYDLGNPNGLEVEMSKMNKGLTSVYKVPGKPNYMVLWVDSVRAPRLKPLDRVQANLRKMVRSQPMKFADSTALVALGDSVVFRESDYQEIYESFPAKQKSQVSREQILKQVLWAKLMAWDAVKNEFPKSKFAQMRMQMTELNFKAELYKNTELMELGQSPKRIDSLLRAKSNYFPPVQQGGREVAALYLELPTPILRAEYLRQLDSLGLPAKSMGTAARDSVFFKLFTKEYPKAKERVLLKSKMQLCAGIGEGQTRMPLFGSATEYVNYFHNLKNEEPREKVSQLAKALNAMVGQKGWEGLAYESAKAWSDQAKFTEALSALDLILYGSESSSVHDKALFMKGYIQMEQLKKDELALKTFSELVRKYPKSSLADDADFLVKDLQSGRKLSQELLRKLESNSQKVR